VWQTDKQRKLSRAKKHTRLMNNSSQTVTVTKQLNCKQASCKHEQSVYIKSNLFNVERHNWTRPRSEQGCLSTCAVRCEWRQTARRPADYVGDDQRQPSSGQLTFHFHLSTLESRTIDLYDWDHTLSLSNAKPNERIALRLYWYYHSTDP